MSGGKAISSSTLSLRFMQNARAKQSQQHRTELEPQSRTAAQDDDAHWEVSQDVKDAWGLGGTSSTPSSSVTYEHSYLPFLFSSSSDRSGLESEGSAIPRGRRAFDKKGREVTSTESREKPQPDLPCKPDASVEGHDGATISESGGSPSSLHPQYRLSSSSASRSSIKPTHISGVHASRSQRSKSAREAIRDSSGVGTDLGPQSRTFFREGTATSAVSVRSVAADMKREDSSLSDAFWKPKVDDPSGSGGSSATGATKKEEGVILLSGARDRSGGNKRVRSEASGASEDVIKQKKKVKKISKTVTNKTANGPGL